MRTIRKSKIGLACAGGVIEGALYEIGALCALEDAVEGLDTSSFDVYVGVSSGALISSLLANGISPRTMSRAVVSQADPLLNVSPEILFTPAFGEYGSRLRKVPRAVFDAVRRHLERPWDISLLGSLAGVSSLLPVGLFTNEPLERHVARILTTKGRTNDFRALRTVLRIVTMHLDSADVVTFGDAEHDHVPISKAVQASTALPGFYCPVEIDGQHYIDGVARRTVHASVALDEGAELLFCINPIVPVHLRSEAMEAVDEGIVAHGLPAVLSQTFRAVIHSRMRTGFRSYDYTHPNADLVLIQPEMDDPRLFFSNIFSFSNRYEVCEYAYRTTLAYLESNFGTIDRKLRRHGFALRKTVTGDTTRRLFDSSSPEAAAGDVLEQAGDVLDRLDYMLDLVEASKESEDDAATVQAA